VDKRSAVHPNPHRRWWTALRLPTLPPETDHLFLHRSKCRLRALHGQETA
jgi:hypothetical protein